MNKNQLHKIANEMAEMMGENNLLQELMQAQSVRELQENLEHIDRMHDLGLMDSEEEELT
jgi:mannitol/fructose-specific phosphotransferase system IIA component (Ntr-type)